MRGWIGPIAGLDEVVKREILFPVPARYQTLVFPSIAYSLY
jgi:hypothetical protein